MAKFRKKPIVIEAFKWTGDEHQIEDPEWACDAVRNGEIMMGQVGTPDVFLIIVTLEGKMSAERGDWIIKGIKGEIYPCKPDIFVASYEEVQES